MVPSIFGLAKEKIVKYPIQYMALKNYQPFVLELSSHMFGVIIFAIYVQWITAGIEAQLKKHFAPTQLNVYSN